jgi:tight adherence protein B
VRAATLGATLPGPVLLDLVAAVLGAGAPVGTALHVVADAAAEHGDEGSAGQLRRLAERHDLGLDPEPGAAPPAPTARTRDALPWVAALAETLVLAREAGVAVAPLLRVAAEEERRERSAAARVAAARLGVQVVLPTGLCLLPAFVLLAVVPLVLALLGAA